MAVNLIVSSASYKNVMSNQIMLDRLKSVGDSMRKPSVGSVMPC